MTDSYHSGTTITSHEVFPAALPNNVSYNQVQRYGLPMAESVQEDDGQISCFCGFPDDDGNTVACDACNRWQHTICYYPQYEGRDLPEQLEHYCIDCKPRHVDTQAAHIRQKSKREQQDGLVNGAKRQVPKSHKKKVKEPTGAAYTNGWPLDKSRHDRNSASPRDQPPPAKRPKTSHRPSESSNTVQAKGHSRKRNASNVNQSRSLSESPDTAFPLYSPEFFRCYSEDDWTETHANLHNDISVTNALSEWLRASEDAFRELHGLEKREVLMRWDGELDEIPGKAQIEIQDVHDDRIHEQGSGSPGWKTLTVKEPVASGAYLGELKGHVGFIHQYKEEPSNRWPLLRHPEPFVFFHSALQLYVDARHEGTELRYVRRSCRPNARLQVLVTDQTDYRFCFMATEQIDPGMEIAVAWDTSDSISRSAYNTNGLSSKDMDAFSSWVSNVLSNCGPCACQLPASVCSMSRFDRRTVAPSHEEAQTAKIARSRKRKPGQHVSPQNTYALNSRSGSEARKADADDEPTDSRSASGSGGRGSASRDITPNTHYSTNGSISAMPELSERERKKLAKEEEMFKRQEEERHGKQSKKKRSSAGSNLNTPGATSGASSRTMTASSNGTKYTDAATARQSGLSNAKPTTTKRTKPPSASKTPATPIARSVTREKPVYVDASTQCDRDEEDSIRRREQRSKTVHKTYLSTTQLLLQRLALRNARLRSDEADRKAARAAKDRSEQPNDSQPEEAPRQPTTKLFPQNTPPTPSSQSISRPIEVDLPMRDATPEKLVSEGDPSESTRHKVEDPPLHSSPTITELPSSQPAVSVVAPEATPPPSNAAVLSPFTAHKPLDMHLQMPPPPTYPPAQSPSAPLTSASAIFTPSAIAQSPSSLLGPAPLFSPSVTAAVHPSPARKKLSLSDYTKRSKAKDKPDNDTTKVERDSSPASVASAGPVVPPLRPSPSEAVQATDARSAIQDEDTKMEDGVDGPNS